MNNPGQYLVHMTSRGPNVYNTVDGGAGLFKVVMKQPLKDINKFGLLHYSVPKRMDMVQYYNRKFNIRLGFADGSEVQIPVTLPLMDYYSTLITQISDFSIPKADIPAIAALRNPRKMSIYTPSLDEVLQTCINWSIMRYYSERAGLQNASLADQMTGRISCIVDFDKPTGCYKFTFGYRGHNTIQQDGTGSAEFNEGTVADSGCPIVTPAVANKYPINTGAYVMYDANGIQRNNAPVPVQNIPQIQLTSVSFVDIPMRLQIMIGAFAPNIISTTQNEANALHTRGRIRLVNYTNAGNQSVGMVTLLLNIPPTLSPPSLLYLQLQVPGTKSKILGQDAERGGWAIPTPPDSYFSNYNNSPNNQLFDILTCRSMPFVHYHHLAAPHTSSDAWNLAMAQHATRNSGSGLNFDGIPYQGAGYVVGNAGVKWLDNFTCIERQGVPGSRMIMYGIHPGKNGFESIVDPRAGAMSESTDAGRNMPGRSGFGAGVFRRSQVFTASLVTPNWIYTNTQDATIQTFDVQLLWGDTCDQVDAIVGNPVQFSIIAST